jgi:hypothetical protein
MRSSKFQAYIDRHTQKRYHLRKYFTFAVFLAALFWGGELLDIGERFGVSAENLASLPGVSQLVTWYNSTSFDDIDIFASLSGILPDSDGFMRGEAAWLARMWGFWAGGVGLVLPFVLFFLFRVGKRTRDEKRPLPSLDEAGISIYMEIRRQVQRAYWRANNHNLEKSFFLISLLGIFLFAVQIILQPFAMLSRDLSVSVLISFMAYTALVYFFYLFRNRFDRSRVIGIVDREMDLRQSLLTALEVGEDYRSSSLYLYLLEETKQKLCGDNILRFFPRRFPRLNYRNITTTVFFMGMTIFLVSISLPVMALVYNNLRLSLLSPSVKKVSSGEVESVILEENGKIKLLKDFLVTRKELPKLEAAAKELSDLSRELDEIVMNEETVGDVQTLAMGAETPPDRSLPSNGDVKNNGEENESQEKGDAFEGKDVIAGASLNRHVAFQLDVMIKDLIRYDMKKKARKHLTSSTANNVKKTVPAAKSLSTLKISSKSSTPKQKKPKAGIVSVKDKRVFSRVKKDVKKLRKLTAMLTDIQYQLDRLQLTGDSGYARSPSGKEKSGKLSERETKRFGNRRMSGSGSSRVRIWTSLGKRRNPRKKPGWICSPDKTLLRMKNLARVKIR